MATTNTNEQLEQALNYQNLIRTNAIRLAGEFVEKRQVEGKQKKDKDGNLLYDHDGAPICYDSKFYAKFSFNGGEIETPVTSKDYEALEDGNIYMLSGRFGLVKNFGSESVAPIFTSITLL